MATLTRKRYEISESGVLLYSLTIDGEETKLQQVRCMCIPFRACAADCTAFVVEGNTVKLLCKPPLVFAVKTGAVEMPPPRIRLTGEN